MKKITIASLIMLGFILLFANCATSTDMAVKEDAPAVAAEGEKPASTIYEAENAIGTGTIVDTKHIGYTGEGFVDFNPNQPGGTITWTVVAEQDGEYNLIFRYAFAEGNRPLEVKVNNEVIAEELAFKGTGDWATWEEVKIKANLKKGNNEVVVKGTGVDGGGNIDHLKVLPAGGGNGFSALYEAEAAKGTGTIVDTKHVGYTGEGFVDFNPNQPGGTLEWEVEVPTEGEYTLQFRYAFAEGNRPLSVKINGEISTEELAFKGTGDWANWQTVNDVATLKAGKNIILVTGLGVDGGGNIDSLKVIGGVEESDEVVIEFDTISIDEMLSKPLVDFLNKEGLFIKDKKATFMGRGNPGIESVKAITDSLILVTFNTGFLKADPMDVIITAAKGQWASLNPKLEYINTKSVAIGANKENKSVFLYQLLAPYQMSNKKEEMKFSGDVKAALVQAKNMVSWQMEHGGWDKDLPHETERMWNGVESKSHSGWISNDGVYTGTIDNDGTIKEIKYLAEVYRETKDKELQASVVKGMDFLFKLQSDKGGIKQVYPQRESIGKTGYYSNYATFNDGAMMNVLLMYDDIINRVYPFDTDLLDDAYIGKIKDSVNRGIDFILKSQIKVDGVLTAWCAQHDPETYEPRGARAYELPSISGSESVNIIKFLMGRPNPTPEITKAVDSALAWLESVKVRGKSYYSGEFHNDFKAETWYRFYDLKTMEPIFSGRDGIAKRDIMEIEDERRLGYAWAGTWPQQLLGVASTTGYFQDKFFAQVIATNSSNLIGQRLQIDSAKDLVKYDGEIKIEVTVNANGSGDYKTVQEAIDAVPSGNTIPFTIKIGAGTFKEKLTLSRDRGFVTLIGAGIDKTILTFDDFAGRDNNRGGTLGTSGSATATLYGSNFTAKNLTFENSFDRSAAEKSGVSGTQAVAVKSEGDRSFFQNVKFVGDQDTLYPNKGTQYFKDCIILGGVDFIFGGAQAVFENCEIISIGAGYVTAASTLLDQEFGYLFLNCNLTSKLAPGTVSLGRPWHPGGSANSEAAVVFSNCTLGEHIKSQPWADMSGFSWKTARFAEYQNKGPGAQGENRKQLTADEAKNYSKANILNGWNPK